MTSTLRTIIRKTPLVGPFARSAKGAVSRAVRRHNVAMLHTGRCGSSVLGLMLDDHPHITWASELLKDIGKLRPEGVGGKTMATRMIRRGGNSALTRVYGFETKYLPQLDLRPEHVGMDLPDYLDLLRGLGYDRFILLERKNYLRRAISVEVARQKLQWHTQDKAAEATRVHLDTRAFGTGSQVMTLVELFEQIDHEYRRAQGLLQNDPLLCINYEDDILGDPRIAYRKVCEFVGVEPGEPEVRLKRTNPFGYDQMVTNFEEVADALRGTRYAWMLDE